MDGGWIRQRAAEVTELADEVRAVAARARRAADAPWESVAARAFRAELDDEVARLLVAAHAVDDAASALIAHALAVEALQPGEPVGLLDAVVRRLLW